VASIRGWWRQEGKRLYPAATKILITADGGGSNGWRLRLWKLELQTFADETSLPIAVCHFPPGTSKWNKIEHRLFPSSRRIGVANHCEITKPSSISLPRRRLPKDCT